jgi:hypothetical protein
MTATQAYAVDSTIEAPGRVFRIDADRKLSCKWKKEHPRDPSITQDLGH